jgi:replication-associated recombination protein RarA
MQKAIRRADERLAMQCVVELMESGKAHFTRCINRIRVTMHEDIDVVSRPDILAAVEATLASVEALRADPTKHSKCRMFLGTVVRMLCRAPKSREGDHFQVAISRQVMRAHDFAIPDWAHDKHTQSGKRMGRGFDHFLTEGTRLVPDPGPDPYQEEAIAWWKREEAGESEPMPMTASPRPARSDPPDGTLL